MSDALFPQPIPIIGCTGEFGSGKTLFGVTISPKETKVYDLEKSSESYMSLGFERVDVPLELQRKYPNGYKPQQTFEWWIGQVRAIEPGRYRVIVVDPASEIESGITEWVRNNPGYFGHTAAQYIKMSGLMWGDVKELWKSIVADLASRCEVFVFTVHMSDVWSGERPVPGKRKPKGKSTLMEMASLYLQMERKADAKGVVPPKPSALVLKSRLVHIRMNGDGEIDTVPALPPRLPIATPAAIRQYLNHPPDYHCLRPEERAPEQGLSDDDRATMKLATAEAERDTQMARLERLERQSRIEARAATKSANEKTAKPESPVPTRASNSPESNTPPATGKPTPPPCPKPSKNGAVPKPDNNGGSRTQTASFSGHAITEEQLQTLAMLRDAWFNGPLLHASDDARREMWQAVLAKRKVNTARALTQEQAGEMIAKLRAQLDIHEMQKGLDGASPEDREQRSEKTAAVISQLQQQQTGGPAAVAASGG